MNLHFIAVRGPSVYISQVWSLLPLFISAHLYKDTGVQSSPHGISFNFNCFYTVYIGESRKALKWFEKKNHGYKDTFVFWWQLSAEKKEPARCGPAKQHHTTWSSCLSTSSAGQEVPPATSPEPPVPPESPLELQNRPRKSWLASVSTNTCVMSAAQIAASLGFHYGQLFATVPQ